MSIDQSIFPSTSRSCSRSPFPLRLHLPLLLPGTAVLRAAHGACAAKQAQTGQSHRHSWLLSHDCDRHARPQRRLSKAPRGHPAHQYAQKSVWCVPVCVPEALCQTPASGCPEGHHWPSTPDLVKRLGFLFPGLGCSRIGPNELRVSTSRRTFSFSSTCYPETVFRIYIINCPSAFQLV